MSKENQELIDQMFGIYNVLKFCDVDDVDEEGIHLKSRGALVPWSRIRAVKQLLLESGYDMDGFELMEIPEPNTFCFANHDTEKYFDIIFKDEKASFAYIQWVDGAGLTEFPAGSIEEAIEKFDATFPEQDEESEEPEFSPEEYERYRHSMEEQEKKMQEVRRHSSAESAANLKLLLDLIRNNPELPVIPVVHQEICDAVDFTCDFTVCKLGKPYIQEYCYYAMGDTHETLMYTGRQKKQVDKDAAKKAKKGVKTEWKTAIFVSVDGCWENE